MFPGSRAFSLVRNGIKITNSTDPISVAKNVTLTAVDCCFPVTTASVRLIANCIALLGATASTAVAPNPTSVGTLLTILGEIYEQCLE